MAAVQVIIATLNELAQVGSLPGALLRRGARLADPIGPDLPEAWEQGPYAQAGVEPLLEDMLHDPLVRLVMRADRIEPAEVRRALDSKRRELSA